MKEISKKLKILKSFTFILFRIKRPKHFSDSAPQKLHSPAGMLVDIRSVDSNPHTDKVKTPNEE